MEGPISFWGYKEQESNLILPEHDDEKLLYSGILSSVGWYRFTEVSEKFTASIFKLD